MLGKNEHTFWGTSQNSEKTLLIPKSKSFDSLTSLTSPTSTVTSISKEERDVEAAPPDLQFLQEKLSLGTTALYIWNSGKHRGKGVGHTALAFNHSGEETYVSYWPKEKVKKVLTEVKGTWHPRRDDLNAEERPPDYVKYLSLLDTKRMFREFQNIQQTVTNWSLLASTPLKDKSSTSMNCISVVVQLLKVGGIETLAGEPIIKEQKDEKDRGVLPYRQGSIDNKVKCSLSWTSTFIRVMLISLFIVSFFIFIWVVPLLSLYSFLGIFVEGLPNISEFVLNPWSYSVMAFCGISLIIKCYYTYRMCRYEGYCCCSQEEIENHNPVDTIVPVSFAKSTAKIAQDAIEIPYDSFRGLIEYTMVPDRRIKKIFDKAEKEEWRRMGTETNEKILRKERVHLKTEMREKQEKLAQEKENTLLDEKEKRKKWRLEMEEFLMELNQQKIELEKTRRELEKARLLLKDQEMLRKNEEALAENEKALKKTERYRADTITLLEGLDETEVTEESSKNCCILS